MILVVFVNVVLIVVATVWLFAHRTVKRRFQGLKDKLPAAYQSAIAVPPEDGEMPQLIALCIDLARKAHCTLPFDTLSAAEQRLALYAYAVEQLPAWMVRYALLRVPAADRALIGQLQQIKTSQPIKQRMHFGAVRRQQQLRAGIES